jgi:hypothetical protein
MGQKRTAYKILVGEPEGKRPLGKPRCRWVEHIKMDLREIGWDGIDWIDVTQDRDQWRALLKIKCWEVHSLTHGAEPFLRSCELQLYIYMYIYNSL